MLNSQYKNGRFPFTAIFFLSLLLTACGGGGGDSGTTQPTTPPPTTSLPDNSSPAATISASAMTGVAPMTITFDGAGSTDSDGTIASYQWDFGDGTTGTGVSIEHEFSDGTFTVTLTVTDNDQASASATVSVTIDAVPNTLPEAIIDASATNGTAPLIIAFSGSDSSDSDGTIVSYEWDFGDGSSGTGDTVEHEFGAGTFVVTLTVTDDSQGSTIDSVSITLEAPDASAPTVISVSPDVNTADVALDAPIEITFSEVIDATSFNANNVIISAANRGVVSGTYSTNGAYGLFEANDGIPSLSRITVSIANVKDLNGNTLVGTQTSRFYSTVDTNKWYQFSNLFLGPDIRLNMNGNNCAMESTNNISDFWKFRVIGDAYTLENIIKGDRNRLEGASIGGNCVMTGMATEALDQPFTGQTWFVTPIIDSDYFRLTNDNNGTQSLDGAGLVESGDFSGQYWRFDELLVPVVYGEIGESTGGSPFDVRCETTDRISSVGIQSGDDIDSINITCIRPNGTTVSGGSAGGSAGGSGGSESFDEVCPAGTVFAGFRGTSYESSIIDQLGIMCRRPWYGEQAFFDLQGLQLTGGERFSESACPVPWKAIGVAGRSGSLIDKMGMLCFPPESTSAIGTAVGGDGGEEFALTCPQSTHAVGIRGRVGDDIDQIRLVCKNLSGQLSETASVGSTTGGDSLGETQVCTNEDVLTGFNLRVLGSGATARIDQINSVCSVQGGLVAVGTGFAGVQNSNNGAGYFGCPAGMFVSGIEGRFGSLLDNIAVRCSSL
jgi:PKD repeat protein